MGASIASSIIDQHHGYSKSFIVLSTFPAKKVHNLRGMVYESGRRRNCNVFAGDACHRRLWTPPEGDGEFPPGWAEHKTGYSYRHFLCHHHWRFGNSWHRQGLGFGKGLPRTWWMLSCTVGLLVLATFFAKKIRATGCCTLPGLAGFFLWGNSKFCRLRPHCYLLDVSHCSADCDLWQGAWRSIWRKRDIIHGSRYGGLRALHRSRGQGAVIKIGLVRLMIILAGMIVLFSKALEVAGPGLLLSQSFLTSAEMGGWDVVSMLLVVGSAYLAFLITSLRILARSLYPAAPSDQAIPVLLTELLSPSSEGLVTAVLLAAFISSADTGLMTATSILTLDIYRKTRPASTEEKLMDMSRLFVLIIGLFGSGISCLFAQHSQDTAYRIHHLYQRPALACHCRILPRSTGAYASWRADSVAWRWCNRNLPGPGVSATWHDGLCGFPIWGKLVGETVC
jgi:hypothetical protein